MRRAARPTLLPFIALFAARREFRPDGLGNLLRVHPVPLGDCFETLRRIARICVMSGIEQRKFDQQPAVSGFIEVLEGVPDFGLPPFVLCR